MIKILFIFINFLLIASLIKFLFNYKIEISMFIAVTVTTTIIAMCGVLGILSIGLYTVYIISLLSLLYCIYYIIKNRLIFNEILLEVFTPGTIILMLAYFIYYIVVRDKVLAYRDEATGWVIEIKYMYELGAYKSFLSHHNIIGFFSYYMTKLVGYSEPIVFLSRWFFVWVCLILPIADLKWKDWVKTTIYAVGVYCIISVINPTPIYYMDMPLGVVAGVLCARWSISKIRLKDYVWLYLGVIILTNIKDELGLIITGLCILYITICNVVRFYKVDKEIRKVSITKLLLNIGLFVCCIVFALQSNMIMNLLSKIVEIIGMYKMIIGIVAAIIAIIALVVFKPWNKINVQKIKKYYGVIFGTVVIVFGLIFYKIISLFYASLSIDLQKTFVKAINTLYNKGYFGKPVYILLALFVIFIIILCIIVINKKYAKALVVQGVSIFIMIVIYALALAIGFVFEQEEAFRNNLSNLHRYYAPIFILASIWLISRVLDGDIEYRFEKAPIIAGLLVMSVLIKELPAPGTVMFNNMEQFRYSVTYGMRADLKADAEIIPKQKDCEKVLIITQPEEGKWDPFSAIAWIRYEVLPIECTGIVLSREKELVDGIYSLTYNSEQLIKYIRNNRFTHIYLYSTNEYFIEEFKDLFNESKDLTSDSLFKVNLSDKRLLTNVK